MANVRDKVQDGDEGAALIAKILHPRIALRG